MNTLVVDSFRSLIMEAVRSQLAIAARFPKVSRVRRVGFSRDVKRGDDVLRRGRVYRVLKRSRHSLWLEDPEQALTVGDTIRVKVPTRYETDHV